jgi:hypothetical protein
MSLAHTVALSKAKQNPDNLSFSEAADLLHRRLAIKIARKCWNSEKMTLFMRINYYNPDTFTLCDNSNHIVFGIYEPNEESKNASDWYVIEWHE